MAQLDLRNSSIGERHHRRTQLRHAAAAQGEDWKLPDLPPDSIASPDAAALVPGDRLVELPGRATERRGCFVRWELHRQRGELLPVLRWDATGHESFSDLKVLTLEQNSMTQTPHPPEPNSIDSLKKECFVLIHRISRSPYNIKLLKAARAALQLVAGYKSKRQQLRDRLGGDR